MEVEKSGLMAGGKGSKYIFFKNFASHWRVFQKLAGLTVEHFKDFYLDPGNYDMGGMLQAIGTFPRIVEEEENDDLFQDVLKEELLVGLKLFQRDKILSPDRWLLEFFVDFFVILGDDMMKVV